MLVPDPKNVPDQICLALAPLRDYGNNGCGNSSSGIRVSKDFLIFLEIDDVKHTKFVYGFTR